MKKLDMFTKLCVVWLAITGLLAIIGPLLPLPDPLESDIDYMGTGFFQGGQLAEGWK